MGALGTIIVLGSIIGLGIFYVLVLIPFIAKYQKMKETLMKDDKTYLTKSGGTSLYFPPSWSKIRDGKFFNYYLRSFDGGKNWYAIDRKKLFGEVVVIGLVDHVYPGLMEHMDGVDKLTKHVEENGSKDLNKKDIEILTDAGFTVSKNKKP